MSCKTKVLRLQIYETIMRFGANIIKIWNFPNEKVGKWGGAVGLANKFCGLLSICAIFC